VCGVNLQQMDDGLAVERVTLDGCGGGKVVHMSDPPSTVIVVDDIERIRVKVA
jgi:hypothetical protein